MTMMMVTLIQYEVYEGPSLRVEGLSPLRLI
jgi:hypothetical protein